MKVRRLILCSVAFAALSLYFVPSADAWRWRRSRVVRSSSATSTYQNWVQSRRPSRGSIRHWSGVNRGEYDYWRRRDAWYDHAYNGWRPEDFR